MSLLIFIVTNRLIDAAGGLA